MNYVYVDNFRGFSETLVPIQDVNFLVGENSTGKTSILAALKLLSPPNFWFQNEFDLRQVGLGTFRDVVSVSSEDQSYFSIGLIYDKTPQTTKGKKGNPVRDPGLTHKSSIVALILTFVEREGMPRLSSFVSYRNETEIRVKYVGKTIRYKSRPVRFTDSSKEFAHEYFREWIHIQKNDKSGYTNIKEDSIFLQKAPPLIVLSYIQNAIAESNKMTERMQFELPSFVHDIAWLAPIRSKPRKTYDEYSIEFSPEGDHTPYLIKRKLDSASESERFDSFLRELGQESGLFRSVEIKKYGRSTTAPFELDVVLDKKPLGINSVGYGVSQALPIVVEIFSRHKNSWFSIQQPEVHLHPRAQAALGEIIFTLAAADHKRFIIETHSDYMIDRFRISTRKSSDTLNSQVLFFERTETGNKITAIPISHDGELSDEQPPSYREFFLKEEMDLLGL